jgi:hypothetical protein
LSFVVWDVRAIRTYPIVDPIIVILFSKTVFGVWETTGFRV